MNYIREATVFLFLICGSLLSAQDLDLDVARTKYEVAVEAANSEYQQGNVKLRGFYDQALDGISLKAQRAGNLDGVTECRKERQRVEDDEYVSLDADEDVGPAILNLRKKLSSGLRDIERKRKTQLTSLYENFARGANQMIVRLTKQSDIKKARDLKAMRDEFEREFTATTTKVGVKEKKSESMIPNGAFEEGLASWETKDVTIYTEVGLRTGRTRSCARIAANMDRRNELFIALPKDLIVGNEYRIKFRYRVPSSFKPKPSTTGRTLYALNVGYRYSTGSSMYPTGKLDDVKRGEWRTYSALRSLRSPGAKLMIGTQYGSGYVDIDDVEFLPR